MHRVARPVIPLLLGALVASLAGCASVTEAGGHAPASASPTAPAGSLPQADVMDLIPGAAGRGLPEGAAGQSMPAAQGGAGWAPDEGLLYVVTFGSSSCPTLAAPQATGHDPLSVRLIEPTAEVCTADFAPTTTVVGVPDGVDDGRPVAVRVGDLGTVQVQPRPVPGEAGPLAWIPAG
jgi:hypothetical protein